LGKKLYFCVVQIHERRQSEGRRVLITLQCQKVIGGNAWKSRLKRIFIELGMYEQKAIEEASQSCKNDFRFQYKCMTELRTRICKDVQEIEAKTENMEHNTKELVVFTYVTNQEHENFLENDLRDKMFEEERVKKERDENGHLEVHRECREHQKM
jgi:hypothetical protein